MTTNLNVKATPKMAAARSFVRSLNILLKFVRLYGFDHVRSAEQFQTAWSELHAAIPSGDETGLLLGAAGAQLVLNGEAIESAHAERSFAQLLSAAGLASIQFLPRVTREDLARFVKAFPAGNAKASVLAEQLKVALANSHGIRINEVRFVAEDSSTTTESRIAASLAAKTLGGDANQVKNWMSDPQKLLQLIAAAEGSRGGAGSVGKGVGTGGQGSGGLESGGSGSWSGSGGSGSGSGTGSGAGGGDGLVGGNGGVGGNSAGGSGSGSGSGGSGSGNGGSGSGPGSGGASGVGGGSGSGSGTGSGSGGGSGVGGSGGGSGSGSGSGGSSNGKGNGGGNGGSGNGGGPGDKIVVGFGGGSTTAVSGPSGNSGGGSGGSAIGGPGSGTGSGSGGSGAGQGMGPGLGPGLGSGSGSGASGGITQAYGSSGGGASVGSVTFSGGGGTGMSGFGVRDEEIMNVLRLLSRLGQSSTGGEGMGLGPGPFQEEISKLSGNSRDVLQQALASLAAQAPSVDGNDPMLLRLAEHLAIRFALDRYERGEVRVNAVRQMLDRMSQEIGALRQILGTHEDKMAQAGMAVESHTDLMDRQFWAAVPEASKRAVLTSPEAWCIPPRNVRQYVEELRRNDDQATATAVLDNYASAIGNADANARQRTAIGLAELADLYAGGDGRALAPAIRGTGLQLGVEREPELQGLISAAFVRLAQEAGSQNRYRAVLQSLDSIDGVERQRPAFAQSVRPRLALEKRLPDFIEEAIRTSTRPDGLIDVIERMPRPTAEYLMNRFNRNGYRPDCERIFQLAKTIGGEMLACLRDVLQTGQPVEAAETIGLLSRLDSPAVEKWLGQGLRDWPRMSQDRALRLLAAGGAPERGWLLLSLFDQFDAMLQPLAVDEIGMAGEVSAAARMLRMASGDLPHGAGPYLRLKAIEALGRLRTAEATDVLREIVEAKKLWRWLHHAELRLVAFQALREIVPDWAEGFLPHSGLSAGDLDLNPRDPSPHSPWFRQRRYARLRMKTPVPATAATGRETLALEIRGLSLSGGLATAEKHSTPGTLVSLRIGSGLRPIRLQAFMRDARAQGLSFEFANMDLDERARLRRFLQDNAAAKTDPRQSSAPSELISVADQ